MDFFGQHLHYSFVYRDYFHHCQDQDPHYHQGQDQDSPRPRRHLVANHQDFHQDFHRVVNNHHFQFNTILHQVLYHFKAQIMEINNWRPKVNHFNQDTLKHVLSEHLHQITYKPYFESFIHGRLLVDQFPVRHINLPVQYLINFLVILPNLVLPIGLFLKHFIRQFIFKFLLIFFTLLIILIINVLFPLIFIPPINV